MDLTETQDHYGIAQPLAQPGTALLLDEPPGADPAEFPPLTPVPRDPPALRALPPPAEEAALLASGPASEILAEPLPADEEAPPPEGVPAEEVPAEANGAALNLFIQPASVAPGTPVPRLGGHDPVVLAEVASPRTDAPMPPLRRPGEENPIDPRVVQQVTAVEQHVIWLGKQVRQGTRSLETLHAALQKLASDFNRQMGEMRDTLRTHWAEISNEKRARTQLMAGNKKMLDLYDEVQDVRDKFSLMELQILLMFWKQRLAEYHIRGLEGHGTERESLTEALQYVRYYQDQIDRRTTGQPASADSAPPAGG